MFYTLTSGIWDSILFLLTVIIALIISVIVIAAASIILFAVFERIREFLFRRELPSLVDETRSGICSELRSINNDLADQRRIDFHVWLAVSGLIDSIIKNRKSLDSEIAIDVSLNFPLMIWQIFMIWEIELNTRLEDFSERKNAAKLFSRVRAENFLTVISRYRRLRHLENKLTKERISVLTEPA